MKLNEILATTMMYASMPRFDYPSVRTTGGTTFCKSKKTIHNRKKAKAARRARKK